MVVRLTLLLGAVALVALGVGRTHERRQCNAGRHDAFAIGAHRLPVTDAPAVASRLIDHCRDVGQLTDGVSALVRVKATTAAAELADEAVKREPERRDAWLALAAVRRLRGDQAGNARALARARQLDPLSFRRRS
jgi:hypothetical protein